MKKIHLILSALIIFSACTKNNSKYEESESSIDYLITKQRGDGVFANNSSISASADITGLAIAGEKDGTKAGKYDKSLEDSKQISGGAIIAKIPSKIRKTAFLNITVDDYKKAHQEIEKIVKSSNGYIGSENEQNTTYSIYNTMVIRVPNKDFDNVLNNVSGIASHINSKNITADDVTAQFIDIETRLKSKKEIEQRFISILQKASKVTDILEIEQKLGEIREEIEAKEGELKYLADQVDYSTINLTLTQNLEYTPIDKPGFWGRTGNAFERGWDGFLGFVVGLVYIWPLLLVVGVGAYFLIRFIRKQLRK